MGAAPIVALEVGTSKVLALVGEIREGGHVMITGMGRRPSVGVRKGEVVDLENATVCVRGALADAEESGKVTIRQIHLAISGGHVQATTNRGSVPVLSKNGEIRREDMDQVLEVARAVNLPPERVTLHTINQHYYVDGEHRVLKPEGMEGANLALDVLVLHGVRGRLRNTIKVIHGLSLDVEDVAFSGLCSAQAVLTAEQKNTGALVLDMGGGTTEYLAYVDGAVAMAGVLGVGGDHVTNDIVLAFSIPTAQAEKLKKESSHAMPAPPTLTQKVNLPAEVGFSGKAVDLRSLYAVVHARLDETLQLIKRRLVEEKFLHRLGAGVILTGGGSHQRGILELVESVFQLPAAIGKPRNVSGLAIATEGPEYAAGIGMVQYGFRGLTEQRRGAPLGGWLKGIFGR
jgi:cell division protein FtsA